jgi:hypothetical protein
MREFTERIIMFNRTLQVDVVKKGTLPSATSDQDEIDFEAKTAIVVSAVERGIKRIGWVVCAYVVLDTVRKVVVVTANK